MLNLLWIILIGIYVGGIWKFWAGFNRTNYSQGRFYLAMLWPVMLLVPSYRQNFNKALKG
jgi:membrane-bound metal-dependent hydrolase YbcI (DUF457 family)